MASLIVRVQVVVALALVALSGVGCGSQAASSQDCEDCEGVCEDGECVVDSDASQDVAADADADEADAVADASTGPDTTVDVISRDVVETDHTDLCKACQGDDECGHGVCLGNASGASCATFCGDGAPCPSGYSCYLLDGADARVCVPSDGACEACVDVDDDGFSQGTGCGETDCAPADPTSYPGAAELCDTRDNDCDGVVDEGISLQSDPMNCGACGTSCEADNAERACVRGACQTVSCNDGWMDCDGDGANGCEALADEANACGGCGALPHEVGRTCGTCDTGVWTCAGASNVVCSGDRGDAAANICGGCGTLDGVHGSACGPCNRGVMICADQDTLRCDLPADAGEWTVCADSCCMPGDVCLDGACGTPAGCTSNDACDGDRFCDVASGACVPWDGVAPGYDASCERIVTVAQFSPQLQCVWDEAPAGTYEDWVHVLATPMVADFNFDGDSGVVRPSIVFTSDDGDDGGNELPTGLIRIIDGRTCETQYTLDMQLTSHSSPPAIGDLDGDGVPEIVAYKANGGLVAFQYTPGTDTWDVMWRSTESGGGLYEQTGAGWGGPALHDLNDDGVPEVIRGATVFDANGVLIDDTLGYVANGSSPANMSFVTDLDGDGRVELATGDGIWEWNVGTQQWDAETYFSGTGARGFVAVADLGDFATPGLAGTLPEVAVVRAGALRVDTLGGTTVFGPVSLPGGGSGGPPTIGDFDGDGRAEVAAAGYGSYTVFDLDCGPSPVGNCASGRTDGILWTRTAQDYSSSQTGSSIFDFEGDGRAEAVYADECFVRVYDGENGDVIFSQYRSSCTWNENPVVADADGDFNSELIVPSNRNCNTTCSGLEPGEVDPQFDGLRCSDDSECVSGACDAGLCRCTDVAECCTGDCEAFGFVCVAPPTGTAGSGNTCRASHPRGANGIRVYSDGLDQWVNSRPIWNQHGYFVTNVNDDGTIPRTSEQRANWSVDGLNNFRQNVQGDLEILSAPDLTSRASSSARYCDASGAMALEAIVCNRGTEALDLGVEVPFYAGDPEGSGTEACRGVTGTVLSPGTCETVACDWAAPPTSAPGVDVYVSPDRDADNRECNEGNNTAVLRDVYCN